MSAPDAQTTGPQVGDRVEVRITGTVRERHHDGMLHIELDADAAAVGDFCPTCDAPSVGCENDTHAWRQQVTTFETPDQVVPLPQDGPR